MPDFNRSRLKSYVEVVSQKKIIKQAQKKKVTENKMQHYPVLTQINAAYDKTTSGVLHEYLKTLFGFKIIV